MKDWSPAVYSTQTWTLAIASTSKLCTLDMCDLGHCFKFVWDFFEVCETPAGY